MLLAPLAIVQRAAGADDEGRRPACPDRAQSCRRQIEGMSTVRAADIERVVLVPSDGAHQRAVADHIPLTVDTIEGCAIYRGAVQIVVPPDHAPLVEMLLSVMPFQLKPALADVVVNVPP